MLRILINAYACSPGMGSEPGMAWNWCVNLARYCELHIITEGEFRDKIEAVVPTLEQGKNIHFYYNPVPDYVRKMCWNQGDWRFYKYYKEWQKKTADIARNICEKEIINILHQLNMIGFREPGYLWQVSRETGIPFVWGPVDAKEAFPMAYANGASLKTKLFLWLKNIITQYQLRYGKRVHEAAKTAAVVLSASSNSVISFKKYFDIESLLINETGTYPLDNQKVRCGDKKIFDILWVGKANFRKQLTLAIKSVAATCHHDIKLHIVGGGDFRDYLQVAESVGIANNCIVHGSVSHDEVLNLMRKSDLFLFTSVAEGTPHVVLEAIGCELPVLCFNTCGQGDCINEEVGFKIPLSDPKQSVKDFAEKINYLYNHIEVLRQMSMNCKQRAEELSWENKAKQMVELYKKVIDKVC
ncbi:MAG: glycosyltransferase [Prevotella ruminicola]|jgi:glycosyltransferase involved in cell wall biosynthesis|uniref:Glycosyltransferase n=1 Tax=Xylanibacter ruminicola TaxID=839 RepID=A0A9D5P6R1_XYLRU|nr:glycosyltransferase [Xylanibacter ruminicola]